jgi:hypothetical protein
MFAARFFGPSYFGPRYFGKVGAEPEADGDYFGNRYFGANYFGQRYFGGALGSVVDPETPPVFSGGGISGAFDWRPADNRQLLKDDEELLVILSSALRLIS